MTGKIRQRGWILVLVVVLGLAGSAWLAARPGGRAAAAPAAGETRRPDTAAYVVLAWNDLGMHCYNANFDELGVLPPYNTLWAQVIQVGDPPTIITTGITVTYLFEDNTTSVTKSNFWDINPHSGVQNAQALFDLPAPLAADMGLAGFGMAGEMELKGTYFEAVGIPLTEFSDSRPDRADPYQVATVVVQDASTGIELARTQPIAPVSTEMHCNYCHYDNGPGNSDYATGVVERNILLKHDEENMDEYPAGLTGPLMDRRPVLCAWCHASAALGAPGQPGVPNLSNAMHEKHSDKVTSTLDGCYSCHPGPQTQCLRDVMSTEFGMDCVDCHGNMQQVSQNPAPWLNEPRCDSAFCHGNDYAQDNALFRLSTEHGGIYCEGCHDSTHAIAPSREAADAIKFIGWQGTNGPLNNCLVCHTVLPVDAGPHGILATPGYGVSLEPDRHGMQVPGGEVVYEHMVRNIGNQTDSYALEGAVSMGGLGLVPGSAALAPLERATVVVTVTLPAEPDLLGLLSTAVITATSQTDAAAWDTATDLTRVLLNPLFLPVMQR